MARYGPEHKEATRRRMIETAGLRRSGRRRPLSAAVRCPGRRGQPRASITATAVAIEELAYYSSSIAAVFDVHCILAGNVLTHGTEAQQQRWLRPVAEGTIVGAFATTEPEASPDLSPQAVQAVAVRHGDTWVLNGRKRWISNSPVAGFIVDTGLPGVRVGEPDQKMGNRGQLTADVWFEDVELMDDALLGGEPEQPR